MICDQGSSGEHLSDAGRASAIIGMGATTFVGLATGGPLGAAGMIGAAGLSLTDDKFRNTVRDDFKDVGKAIGETLVIFTRFKILKYKLNLFY